MVRFRAIFAITVVSIALVASFGTAGAQDGPSVTVEPSTGLSDGDTLTVTATGFPADSAAFSSGQCVTPLEDFLQQCDVTNIVPVPLDSEGSATFEITIKVGPIGTGMCGEGEVQCVIAVGSLTESEAGGAPIFFGADAPPTAEAPAEDTTEELADTGPRENGIMVVGATAALIAGLMLVSTSRRRRGFTL